MATWSLPRPTTWDREVKRVKGQVSELGVLCVLEPPPPGFRFHGDVYTHQRTEAGARQRHGEGRHGDGPEVEYFGIDVQRRQGLGTDPVM